MSFLEKKVHKSVTFINDLVTVITETGSVQIHNYVIYKN